MRNVIVTGASGFIGRSLVNALVNKGYKVYALARHFDSEMMSNRNVECIDVSSNSFDDIVGKLRNKECECMYHFAWIGTSGLNRQDYHEQLKNVEMTCEYVTLCKEIGCAKFIYASSINETETYEYFQLNGIKPSGGYIYGTGKLCAHLMGETIAYQNGIDFVPVMITNIYGVGEKSARLIYTTIVKLMNGEHCSFTEGKQMYDFIYISDAVNSIIAVGEKGRGFTRYYLGGGEPKPLREFLLQIKNIINPSADFGFGDIPFNGIDIDYSQFELKQIEKDTDYRNRVSFEDGVRLTMEYIKEEKRHDTEI